MTNSSERGTAPADWAAILAVFAMVIAFTYTDDLVEFILAVTDIGIDTGQLMVAGLDLLLIAATARLKWRITARGDGPLSLRNFLSQLLRSWWSVGATLVVVLHMFVIGLSDNLGQGGWLWTSLPISLLFVVAMGLVLVSTLDSGPPFGAGAWSRNGWILPLIIGTFTVQIASALWYPAIYAISSCDNQISTDFFAQMVQVIPMLLITLGIELSFVRRAGSVRGPGQRAAPILTVVMLCVAEGLAFSMLVKADATHCSLAAVWHEYIAFVVAVQATAIALATLVWLLLSEATE